MDIKTTCLAILSQGDASGYGIKKTFEDGPFSQIQDAGFGSIYPALARLHGDALVTVTEMPQNGRPGKKVYSITPAGRLALIDALGEPSGPDRFRSDFLFRMLFAHLLSPRDLEVVIETRLNELREAVERMADCSGCTGR
ncbi:MAG: PadR family transcriptional regulator [Alphaproteobacteria bacterium]